MTGESENKGESFKLRERFLPLPSREDGYRSVLMIGTFGAGKTTTIRQLLGTDPKTERFPATNPGKTTVADAEYVLTRDTMYRAVVTFFDLSTVKRHLSENFVAAGRRCVAERNDYEVFRALVDHHASRFRFSYLFGLPESPDELVQLPGANDVLNRQSGSRLRDASTELLAIVSQLRAIADVESLRAREWAAEQGFPEAEVANHVEQHLDEIFSDSGLLNEFIDLAIDLIFNRIEAVTVGVFEYDQTGWPVAWTHESTVRQDFLEEISLFTSNDYRKIGELIFPLVNGVRVSGPFKPAWAANEDYRLVIADSQGLEHSSVGNLEAEDMDRYDVVAVVDNAVQPMQQAPWERLCYLVSSGNAAKTRILFSKFDQAGGDGIGSLRDRVSWIRGNFMNPIERDREVYGPAVTRLLKQLAVESTYYLGHLDRPLDPGDQEHEFTIAQLRLFVASLFKEDLESSGDKPLPVVSRDRIWDAVRRALDQFRRRWKGYLGISLDNDFPKAHWATMKALTRRLGEGWAEEHGHLAPVAQFRSPLERELFEVVAAPDRWTMPGTSESAKDETVQEFARLLQPVLREIAHHRVAATKRSAWYEAYSRTGNGSSFVRARIVDEQVIDVAGPRSGTAGFDELVFDILAHFEVLAREGFCFLID